MDIAWYITIFALGLLASGLAWIFKNLYTQLGEQQRQLESLRVEMARDYVRDSAMAPVLREIRDDMRGLRSEFHDVIEKVLLHGRS
jgi:hypothetical protein